MTGFVQWTSLFVPFVVLPLAAVAVVIRRLSPKWTPSVAYLVLTLSAHGAALSIAALLLTIPILLAAWIEVGVFILMVALPMRAAAAQDVIPLWASMAMATVPAVCYAWTLSSTVLPFSWRGWIGVAIVVAWELGVRGRRELEIVRLPKPAETIIT